MMRTRAVALAAAAATTLSGCSMLTGAQESDSTGASQSAGSSESSGGSASDQSSGDEGGDATTTTALAAGIDPENPPKPIAKGVFRPTDSKTVESTTIELIKLQPKDNVMLAVFRFTGEGRGTESTSIRRLMGDHEFKPVLIDLKNLEKYSTIKDLSTVDWMTKAPLGESMYYFTAFPLPRDGVETMDLRLSDQMGAIEGVRMPQ